MVRVPYYSNFTTLKKGSWSPEEDRKLKAYIKRYGIWNWAEMPKAAGLSRSGKSCRLRWVNYLKPGIRRGNFSREEEETILKLHGIMGNRWSAIAARLPGRTDNEIKNYWHTKLRKLKGSINITNPAAQIRTKSQAKGKTPISSTVIYQDSPKEEAGFSIMMGGSDQQQPYAWSPQLPIDFSSSSSASTSKVAIVGAGDEILGISENPFSASDSSSPSSSSSSVTSGVMEEDLEAFPLLMGEELFMLGDYFNWEITCPDLGDDQDWVQEPLWT